MFKKISIKNLATSLVLSSVLTPISMASSAVDQESLQLRSQRLSTHQQSYWRDFVQSKQAIVPYIATVADTKPEAALWLLKTGGLYGIDNRQATAEEEQSMRQSLAKIGNWAVSHPDRAGNISQEYNAGAREKAHEQSVISILLGEVAQLRANVTALNRIVGGHSSRIGDLEDQNRSLETRLKTTETRTEEKVKGLEALVTQERSTNTDMRQQIAQQFQTVTDSLERSERKHAEDMIRLGEQRSLDLQSLKDIIDGNRAEAKRERDELRTFMEKIDREAKEREAKYQAEAKERESKLEARIVTLEKDLKAAHERIDELVRQAEIDKEAIRQEARAARETLETKFAADRESLEARLERAAGVQQGSIEAAIAPVRAQFEERIGQAQQTIAAQQRTIEGRTKELRSALRRLPVTGDVPLAAPRAPRAVVFTPAPAAATRALSVDRASTPSTPSTGPSRPHSAASVAIVDQNGDEVLPGGEASLGTLSAHTEVPHALRRMEIRP